MENLSAFADIKVDAFTTPDPLCIDENTPLSEVLELMDSKGIRHLPVKNAKGELVGILSDRNVNFTNFMERSDIKAKDVMTLSPLTVTSGSSLLEAVFQMSDNKIGSLVVLDDEGEVTGIFTSIDALNALVEILRGEILENE